MATYEVGDSTSYENFIALLKAFCVANGWTVAYEGTYNGGNWLCINKGTSAYISLWPYGDGLTANLVGHIGLNTGLAPTAQPVVSAVVTAQVFTASNTHYEFFSSGNSMYCVTGNVYSGAPWFGAWGFGVITDKIGSWDGGTFVQGNGVSGPMIWGHLFEYNGYALVYKDGAWTPKGVGVNAIIGGNHDCQALPNCQPNSFNAEVLPIPLKIFQRLSTDATKYRPIGYAPGVIRLSGGTAYVAGDQIVKDTDTYQTASVQINGYSGVAHAILLA